MRGRRAHRSEQLRVEIMKNKSFGGVASGRKAIARERFYFIFLEADSSTLVMVCGIFVTQNALFDLATLAPKGGALVVESTKGKTDERAQGEFRSA